MHLVQFTYDAVAVLMGGLSMSMCVAGILVASR